MRAVVTCEHCGHRHTVARAISGVEVFHLVCHLCERSLRVEVTERDLQSSWVAVPRLPASPPGAA